MNAKQRRDYARRIKSKYPLLSDSVRMNRPNKTALGMSQTARRSGSTPDGLTLTLCVRGTLAKVKRRPMFAVKNKPCPCCGERQGGPLCLTEEGRAFLERLRQGKTTAIYNSPNRILP